MFLKKNSYCPFRVQTPDHQAGCTLQLGLDAKCYTQEKRPLRWKNNFYICLIINIRITIEIFNQLEILLDPLMRMQDEYEIAINVWLKQLWEMRWLYWRNKYKTNLVILHWI